MQRTFSYLEANRQPSIFKTIRKRLQEQTLIGDRVNNNLTLEFFISIYL